MPRPVKIPYQGEELEGQEMDFETVSERWNEYRLEDGSRVKVRSVVMSIVKTSKKNEVGEPLVIVKAKTLVSYHEDGGTNAD